jgi:hypothetical protein
MQSFDVLFVRTVVSPHVSSYHTSLAMICIHNKCREPGTPASGSMECRLFVGNLSRKVGYCDGNS